MALIPNEKKAAMITGERLMIYLGVALMLLGAYTILGDALSLTPSIVSALGGFVFSIGLIMSYVGSKARGTPLPEIEVELGSDPLGHLRATAESGEDKQKKRGGNRAFGLILISVGAFILLPTFGLVSFFFCCTFSDIASFLGVLGLLFASPLSMLGIICLSFGIAFHRLISSN
jgi:hypothetical protein